MPPATSCCPAAPRSFPRVDRRHDRRAAALLDAARSDRRRCRHRLQRQSRATGAGSDLMRHTRDRLVDRRGRRSRRRAPLGGFRRRTSSSSAAATSGSGPPGICSQREPGADVVRARRRASAGTARAGATAGSSRRSGATCRSCAIGPATPPRSRVCRASEDAVRGIGAWCEENEVDAWFRAAPLLRVATTARRSASWDARAGRAAGSARRRGRASSADEVRARCASPLFLGGALHRLNATVQPARLALGLRATLLERGVRIHEGSEVTRSPPRRRRRVACAAGPCRSAPAAVIAAGGHASPATGSRSAPPRATSCSPSPCPTCSSAGLDGRRGDRGLPDARHYLRTTKDGRIVFGWGGGAMGSTARVAAGSSSTRRRRARPRRLDRFFPQLRGREITHAWGGPIDVSPTHLPIFGCRGACTTAAASPGTASGPHTSAARSSRGSRSTGATS